MGRDQWRQNPFQMSGAEMRHDEAVSQYAEPSRARHLEGVLTPLIAAHPDLLGLGIDEGAAIVVHGGEFKVIGDGRVAIYDGKNHAGRVTITFPEDRNSIETTE